MKLKPATILASAVTWACVAIMPAAYADATITQGQLTVGTDLTYPPYNYLDDSNLPAGFDVDLLTALSKAANLEVRFLDTRFENLIIGVSSDQFDVIASTLYVRPERARQIDYIPYMKSGISIAVLNDSGLKFQKLEDLCGHTVGSVKSSAWLERIEEINQAECAGSKIDAREFPTAPEASQALLSGGIVAQIEDSAVLGEALRILGGRIVITNDEQLYPVIIGLGLKKGNRELADLINRAMADIQANGEYQALLDKYNVASPTDQEFRAAAGE